MSGIVLRIVKQILNDKRTLALILVAPVLILSLLYLLMGESTYVPKIAVDGSIPDKLVAELEKQDVTLIDKEEIDDADALLKNDDADAVVTMDSDGIHIRVLENTTKVAEVSKALKDAVSGIAPSSGMDVSYVYGREDDASFNSLGYVLLGVLAFFFVFIISGISFVRERETGTLERLMSAPVRRWEVAAGYTLGFGIFAAAQSIVITLFTRYVLGLEFEGSVLLAMLIMVLLSFTAVSLGSFFSIFANNEFQVMQFIPIVIIPQIFFSGLIPIDTMPYGLGNLAYIMPVYYGCTALHGVLIMGSGFGQIWGDLAILLLFLLLFSILNVLVLKKYRRL